MHRSESTFKDHSLKDFYTCDIWYLHDGEVSSRVFLGREAVYCCGRIPKLQRSMVPPSSAWTSETMLFYQNSTRRHNPEQTDFIFMFKNLHVSTTQFRLTLFIGMHFQFIVLTRSINPIVQLCWVTPRDCLRWPWVGSLRISYVSCRCCLKTNRWLCLMSLLSSACDRILSPVLSSTYWLIDWLIEGGYIKKLQKETSHSLFL
jgi:hypothetical protein